MAKAPQGPKMGKFEESRKGGLGRGLAALIPSGPEKPRLSDSAADAILGGTPAPKKKPGGGDTIGRKPDPREPGIDSMGATYQEIPIGKISPNENQPRQVFDPEQLGELVHSIREFGLLQPIVVRPVAGGYELIMGERRWRAASKAGLKTIPAIVRETDDSAMLRDALLENIHRVELNPLEEGAAYQQLLEEFGVTQEELAKRLGRARSTVTNTIRLLQLPIDVQTRVAAGVLSAGHARAIMSVKTGEADQVALAERVVAEGLSVRATEEAATLLNRGEKPAEKRKREPIPQPEYFTRSAERLADAWDTKVTVTMGKRKGKMVVEFSDQDDFERIMGLLGKA
ncbi:ParB/RepB/Spo0J family partition protein [Corynebacterium renale]|uniref:ParB family chromosome partitioning protein n=1 Tax=Corynebacterium renale TaxID=1724 RepID=A0A2A9DNV3_9CORY|nr:ParB/RepB/Spo0J family partition protein [Corynebacterium renale]PFG27652.1 ParB family chromosome partitioning protein [Corynebacterium renale]